MAVLPGATSHLKALTSIWTKRGCTPASSLRVAFDGTANVDFQNIWQYVAVKPNTRYRFGAYVQTEDLTTDSGIHFEIDPTGMQTAVDAQHHGYTTMGTQRTRVLHRTTDTSAPTKLRRNAKPATRKQDSWRGLQMTCR